MLEPSGIMLIDKPEGMTSRRVAQALGNLLWPARRRGRQGERRFRVGHAGTLDPLATGLLVILVGRGTRLAPFLQGLDKTYSTTVRLGSATDSHDREGKITATKAVAPLRQDEIEAAAACFRGVITQVPPVISSIKRGGRSLHRLVRAGRKVAEPEARCVRIDRLEILDVRWGLEPGLSVPTGYAAPDGLLYEIDLGIDCASGTYVRALARDLGAALGTFGHVQALRRLRIGPFGVEQALAFADIHQSMDPGPWLLSLADALPHLPAFDLTHAQVNRVRHGGQPDADWIPKPMPQEFCLLDPSGHLAAIGRCDPMSGEPATMVVFPDEATQGTMTETETGPCGLSA